ncbi:sirohydrochlorin chelatase [Brockia lithotrophica]|uniref:Sirohydrochlorin ferrochelatase n=1 Tax=Brockia lithotrophica TaxID=933949 RepID=A0A660L535_9BACL|nr:CbiX/SirB N-terminal domain-containing protein [Brockia lithotrophica]RKQ88435.1 sirohydrochlorin ferrochelatase [Brockia lithotrophica]
MAGFLRAGRRPAPWFRLVSLFVALTLLWGVFASLAHASAGAPVPGREGIGVLLVAHGTKEDSWTAAVEAVRDELQKHLDVPVVLGYLEAVEPTIPQAVKALADRGVRDIVAVPFFVSSYSNHIEEIRYILGLHETPPDPSEDLPRAQVPGRVFFTPAVDDHPMLAAVLTAVAAPFLQDPEKDVVILAAHGSDTPEGQAKWEENLNSLGELVKRFSDGRVRDVRTGYVSGEARPALADVAAAVVAEGKTAVVLPVMMSEGFFTGRKIPSLLQTLPEGSWRYPPEGKRALVTADRQAAATIALWRVAEVLGPNPLVDGQPLTLDRAMRIGRDAGLGYPCIVAGTALAWRVLASGEEGLGGPLERDGLAVRSFLPPNAGSRPVMEAAAKDVRYLGIPMPLLPEAPTFFFVREGDKRVAVVRAMPELFGGEEFFALRNRVVSGRASPEEAARFQEMQREVLVNLLAPKPSMFTARLVDPIVVRGTGGEERSVGYADTMFGEQGICLGGTFLYRAVQEAVATLRQTRPEFALVQGNFTLETKLKNDRIEKFLAAVAGDGNFTMLEDPPVRPESFVLTLTAKDGTMVRVRPQDGVLEPEFFALRAKVKAGEATPAEKARAQALKNAMIVRLLLDPKAFAVEVQSPTAGEQTSGAEASSGGQTLRPVEPAAQPAAVLPRTGEWLTAGLLALAGLAAAGAGAAVLVRRQDRSAEDDSRGFAA